MELFGLCILENYQCTESKFGITYYVKVNMNFFLHLITFSKLQQEDFLTMNWQSTHWVEKQVVKKYYDYLAHLCDVEMARRGGSDGQS